MGRAMIAIHFDNKGQLKLWELLTKVKINILDCREILDDITNDVIGVVYFVEGPKLAVNLVSILSNLLIRGGEVQYVRTNGTKIKD